MVLVLLKLGKGNWQAGFPHVTAQIWENPQETPRQVSGSLPPARELEEIYHNWRIIYEALGNILQPRSQKPLLEFDEEDNLTQVSDKDLENLSKQLQQQFNTWLNSGSFSRIERQLRTQLNPQDKIRIILETDHDKSRRIPWHLWEFFEDYPHAEIALSSQEYGRVSLEKKIWSQQVRILAILGNSEGINIQKDLEILQNLPQSEIIFLVEPSRQELDQYLWDELGWDILFFAGHSVSHSNAVEGELEINPQEKITIPQLRNALKKAINLGLQLAIFNSCDGLGLAYQLADLQIPQMIVMRENVPDFVAQTFLKHFLKAFAQGKPFYLAVREARERLQGLEPEYPCASWLPVICQNPTSSPLHWQDLVREVQPRPPVRKKKWRHIILSSLVVSLGIMGLRLGGVLQTWELQALDYLTGQLPTETLDPRLVIIGADEEDISGEGYGFPLSDEILLKLLQELKTYKPAVIGIDIFRDQPVPLNSESYAKLQQYWQQEPNLVGICTFSDEFSQSLPPPASLPADQVGFVDLYSDSDEVVRRYLLSRSSNSPQSLSRCTTSYSFAWQLAYRYLKAKGVKITTVGNNWQFGDVIFPRLTNRSGGYQKLNAQGNQILINYRRSFPLAQQLTVRDILERKAYLNPDWLTNRIVLIGVTAESVPDRHDTPRRKIRGIEIHAHVVSEIVNAVENGRPLMWWLPPWGDFLLVFFWSILGAIAVSLEAKIRLKLTIAILMIIILYSSCWLLLLRGAWLPFLPSLLGFIGTGLFLIISSKYWKHS